MPACVYTTNIGPSIVPLVVESVTLLSSILLFSACDHTVGVLLNIRSEPMNSID
jgi:hypothetical protein